MVRGILEEAQTIVSDALSAVLVPERGIGPTSQQTVREAKEEWRNEENPN